MTEEEIYMKPKIFNRDPISTITDVKGPEYLRYREQWRQASNMELKTTFPLHVDLDIIDNCNKRCPMCLQWKNPGFTGKKMSLTLFDRILKEVVDKNGKAINIGSNSEPAYDPRYLQTVLQHLQPYSSRLMDVFVHTNGLSLTENFVSSLLEAGVTNIIFSFGILENSRLNDVVVKNIIMLYKMMKKASLTLPVIRLEMIPIGVNQKEMDRVIDMVSSFVDYIGYQYLVDANNLHTGLNLRKMFVRCVDPWRRMYIDVSGRMYQCCGFTGFSQHLYLGSLDERHGSSVSPIFDVWNSPHAEANRMAMKTGGLKGCKKCLDLFYKYVEIGSV